MQEEEEESQLARDTESLWAMVEEEDEEDEEDATAPAVA